MNKDKLDEILTKHKQWLLGEDGGQRANLRYANLRYANLSGANLSGADLSDANLSDANLSGANLSDANLSGADLRYANLRGANLSDANLSGADLRYADLSGANLRGANLRYADLRYADLSGANLRGANLSDANLSGADLSGIITNHYTAFYHLQCPEEGSFIGYKKAGSCIVKLLITEDALRSSATSRKCRASKAKVLDITHIKTGVTVNTATSDYDNTFIYKVGEEVKVDNFDTDRWNECSTGIHFFITKQEAIDYV